LTVAIKTEPSPSTASMMSPLSLPKSEPRAESRQRRSSAIRHLESRRLERRRAEGRPHWVPSMRDFEMAVRDCWDDLVKP
jgi:hypothetical protein